ncbi:hypothetical protein DRN74_02450 [Candidatus Micrarchaeota archaeon]|nr:MAG: hypothetical protein DRN74_02450 [Candidatus Micrarchaeota archaeon]
MGRKAQYLVRRERERRNIGNEEKNSTRIETEILVKGGPEALLRYKGLDPKEIPREVMSSLEESRKERSSRGLRTLELFIQSLPPKERSKILLRAIEERRKRMPPLKEGDKEKKIKIRKKTGKKSFIGGGITHKRAELGELETELKFTHALLENVAEYQAGGKPLSVLVRTLNSKEKSFLKRLAEKYGVPLRVSVTNKELPKQQQQLEEELEKARDNLLR